MKVGLFILIIICAVFIYCNPYFNYESPKYVKMAHEITDNVAKKLKIEKDLHLIGTGGSMMNDIQMMAMSFEFYQQTNIEKARKLIIYSGKEYLSAINSNEEIRPFLHNYPFTNKNIEIMILFCQSTNENDITKIKLVSLNEGIVNYYTYNSQEQLCKICEESFEDALKLVK